MRERILLPSLKRLKRSFFARHPKEVAPRLLGKYLISKMGKGEVIAKIVETEAYGGREDLGCHVGRFGRTKRTLSLFGKVGLAYIYPVHINTYCLNVVCHKKAQAGGVLIRALELLKGKNLILRNFESVNKNLKIAKLLSGPGKLCRLLEIDLSLNGEDLVEGRRLYFAQGERVKKDEIISTPRINIPYAGISKRWHWRFVIKNSPSLSK